MKYKGNKALMKCCKSCQSKKGIRCTGEPRIFKYQGYKFCTECTRTSSDIEKSFRSLKARINLNKRIRYFKSEILEEKMTSRSYASQQKIISQLDIEEIEKMNNALDRLIEWLLELISKVGSALKSAVNGYGKSKEV